MRVLTSIPLDLLLMMVFRINTYFSFRNRVPPIFKSPSSHGGCQTHNYVNGLTAERDITQHRQRIVPSRLSIFYRQF